MMSNRSICIRHRGAGQVIDLLGSLFKRVYSKACECGAQPRYDGLVVELVGDRPRDKLNDKAEDQIHTFTEPGFGCRTSKTVE